MTIKAYLLMVLTPLLLVALAFLFQLIEKISSAKLFQIFCTALYWVLSAVIMMAWLFVALTFFVYSLPSVAVAIILYGIIKRSFKYQDVLQKKDSRFYRGGIRIMLASILFLVPLGITFTVLHFLTSA